LIKLTLIGWASRKAAENCKFHRTCCLVERLQSDTLLAVFAPLAVRLLGGLLEPGQFHLKGLRASFGLIGPLPFLPSKFLLTQQPLSGLGIKHGQLTLVQD